MRSLGRDPCRALRELRREPLAGLRAEPLVEPLTRVADKQTNKPAQVRFWSENSCKAPLLAREAVPGAFSGLSGFTRLFISNSTSDSVSDSVLARAVFNRESTNL